jgi:hypothetical protein
LDAGDIGAIGHLQKSAIPERQRRELRVGYIARAFTEG